MSFTFIYLNISTQDMDFVEIFDISLDLYTIHFAHLLGVVLFSGVKLCMRSFILLVAGTRSILL